MSACTTICSLHEQYSRDVVGACQPVHQPIMFGMDIVKDLGVHA